MRNSILIGLALLTALAGDVSAYSPAESQGGAARPYILRPGGVKETYRNGFGIFTADIICGRWSTIVQFTAGTGGQRVFTKTIYVCESSTRASVRFTLKPAQLAEDGNYQFRLKVGRHNNNGDVTRWTDSIVGSFTKS